MWRCRRLGAGLCAAFEGDLLDHVRANQPKYLGAVFAIVREWHRRGKPRSAETRHDFRGWAQTLDWIVQHLLGAAPLLDGHRETQQRMTNPAMNWLRDVAIAVVNRGRAGEWMFAANLLDIIDADGSIEIPGQMEGADLENATTRTSILTQIGKRLGRCFGEQDCVALDGLLVERERFADHQSHQRKRYRVRPADCAGDPPDAPLTPDVAHYEWTDSADDPADEPLMAMVITSQSPPDDDHWYAPPDDPQMIRR